MVQRVGASGSIHIRADGSIEPLTANITSVDNVTFTFTGEIHESIVIERDNIVVDGAGHEVQGTGSGTGIDLSGRGNVTIKNVTIKTFNEGIGGAHTSYNNAIVGNNITNNGDGIVGFSFNNSIVGNSISANSRYGVLLASSSNNNIVGNNIAKNTVNGVVLSSSSNNSIVGNNITNNGDGVVLSSSSNNSIVGNNITNNGDGIIGSSSDNSIVGNNISANSRYGLDLAFSLNNRIIGNSVTNNRNGIQLTSSSGNLIYQNDFEDNSANAYVQMSSYPNSWDEGYPVGGNYWSDYDVNDFCRGLYQNENGSDGIGDTPFTIDPNNTDRYPLMGMFSDFNVTPEYSVQTVCNSTISGLQYNGTTIEFNVSSEKGNFGFCRICIPTALMNGTYGIFANGTLVLHTLLPSSKNALVYLYFTYNLPTQEISVIPEAPTFLILPPLATAVILAKLVYRRKYKKRALLRNVERMVKCNKL
jgi:parallel beta-helix repeat protein